MNCAGESSEENEDEQAGSEEAESGSEEEEEDDDVDASEDEPVSAGDTILTTGLLGPAGTTAAGDAAADWGELQLTDEQAAAGTSTNGG